MTKEELKEIINEAERKADIQNCIYNTLQTEIVYRIFKILKESIYDE